MITAASKLTLIFALVFTLFVAPASGAPERIAGDTPKKTFAGNTFVAPAGWSVDVRGNGGATVFDFGEWSSEMASRKNPDGTMSFITIVPGFNGLEFVAGNNTLTLRDAQHEYAYNGTSARP